MGVSRLGRSRDMEFENDDVIIMLTVPMLAQSALTKRLQCMQLKSKLRR